MEEMYFSEFQRSLMQAARLCANSELEACLLNSPMPSCQWEQGPPGQLVPVKQTPGEAPMEQAVPLPRWCDPQVLAAAARIPEGATTIIVRNIPARCSQAQLLKFWPPQGSYNLLFLPYNHRLKRTVGYAFVNFISHEAMLKFINKWQGMTLMPNAKAKRLNIAAADVQGFEDTLRSFMENKDFTSHRSDDRLPMVLKPNGDVIAFRDVMVFMKTMPLRRMQAAQTSEEGIRLSL